MVWTREVAAEAEEAVAASACCYAPNIFTALRLASKKGSRTRRHVMGERVDANERQKRGDSSNAPAQPF
jgi:hypothetical protein